MAQPVRARRLTDEEGRRLQQIVRRGKHGSIRVRRAMIIMASASGTLVPAIARLVAADEDTVRDVIHAFNEIGLRALDPQWAGGRPRRISERGHAEGEPTRANQRTYAATTGTAQSAVRSANRAASADESAPSTPGTATDNHAAWRVRPTAGVTRSSSRST